ncbi:unnamed protein product [Phaedon cochleariae]|uniref:THAP-type domain-containing protein n=1 Tax=Phaedon cochleariae TaxID=80249 RepID=A0A9N9SKL7_PHACE|nr:unnamed protein product [Phaedon cochleariae]
MICRFPTDEKKLKMWCDALKLDPLSLKKDSYICSIHFEVNQIIKMPQGKSCLSSDAIPKLLAVETIEIAGSSAEVAVFVDSISPEHSPSQTIELHFSRSPTTSTSTASEMMNIDAGSSIMKSPSLSTTSTAPEMIDSMKDKDYETIKIRSPALSTSTFTAPETIDATKTLLTI